MIDRKGAKKLCLLHRFVVFPNCMKGNWTVDHLNLSGPIRRRLHDLGLIEGTKVRCLYKSAWQDPVAYSIRSTVIALRNVDTRSIFVRPNPGCGR